jgi:ABC-type nitrate/sulfonate/bicarbonate transport system substrate-binding protein
MKMSQNSIFRKGMSRREFLKIAGITGAAGVLNAFGGTFLSGCAPKDITTSFQLGWVKNVEFAGYYAADYKGYYADEGLTVELAAGGPAIEPISLIDSGAMDIAEHGISLDVIKTNNEGARVIAFATLTQSSPAGLLYIIKDPDGNPGTIIDTPNAAKGKRIGLQSVSNLAWRVMAYDAGLSIEDDMEIVLVGFDASPLLDGTVDAYWGYVTNQKLMLELMGYEVGYLDPYEWGYKVPGNFIGCNKDFYNENKDLLEGFVRGSIHGWNYAYDHKEELAQYVIDNFGEESGLEFEQQVLELAALEPFTKNAFTEENGFMSVNMEDWENAIRLLVDMGEISSAPELSSVVTTEIVDAVYKDGRIDQA